VKNLLIVFFYDKGKTKNLIIKDEYFPLMVKKITKNLTRAFLCITFPDEVIKEIARIQEILSDIKFTGKLTELENLHLTLKFLGEIEDGKIEEIKNRLSKLKFDAFEAKLLNMGTFCNRSMPRIVWVKIGGAGIFELQKQVDDILGDLFKKEERFMSHMTIARVKHVSDSRNFKNYIKNMALREVRFNVSSLVFMKSELGRTGPRYTEMYKVSL